MKIGILGGSFDPPHIGHYLMLKQIQELYPSLDKIFLIPAYQHQWKKAHAKTEDRLNMLKCLTNEKVEISDIEINRGGVSYSVDTVRDIKKQTNGEIFWLAGSDILGEFDRWEKTDELLDLATFLIFPRDPYHLPQNIPDGFQVISDKHLITTNISSTTIRERLKLKKTIAYLVPHEVEEYIKSKHLYE